MHTERMREIERETERERDRDRETLPVNLFQFGIMGYVLCLPIFYCMFQYVYHEGLRILE